MWESQAVFPSEPENKSGQEKKKMNARYFQTVQIISKGNLLFSFLLQLEGLKEALPVTQSIVCRSSDDL